MIAKNAGLPDLQWDIWELFGEMYRGKRWCIVADDTTGPPVSGLHPQRRAWAAVFLPPQAQPGLFQDLDVARQQLYELTGTRDFSFKDLLAEDAAAYRCLTLEQRLGFLELFVDIFGFYSNAGMGIGLMQFDPEEFQRLRADGRRTRGPELEVRRGSAWTFDDYDAAAQHGALWAAVNWIRERDRERPITAVADRWHNHAGVAGGVSIKSDKGWVRGLTQFDPPAVLYETSGGFPPLQLADFAAWSFSRLEASAKRRPLQSSHDRAIVGVLHRMVDRYVWLPEGLHDAFGPVPQKTWIIDPREPFRLFLPAES